MGKVGGYQVRISGESRGLTELLHCGDLGCYKSVFRTKRKHGGPKIRPKSSREYAEH